MSSLCQCTGGGEVASVNSKIVPLLLCQLFQLTSVRPIIMGSVYKGASLCRTLLANHSLGTCRNVPLSLCQHTEALWAPISSQCRPQSQSGKGQIALTLLTLSVQSQTDIWKGQKPDKRSRKAPIRMELTICCSSSLILTDGIFIKEELSYFFTFCFPIN